jgi:hypothetical protein
MPKGPSCQDRWIDGLGDRRVCMFHGGLGFPLKVKELSICQWSSFRCHHLPLNFDESHLLIKYENLGANSGFHLWSCCKTDGLFTANLPPSKHKTTRKYALPLITPQKNYSYLATIWPPNKRSGSVPPHEVGSKSWSIQGWGKTWGRGHLKNTREKENLQIFTPLCLRTTHTHTHTHTHKKKKGAVSPPPGS